MAVWSGVVRGSSPLARGLHSEATGINSEPRIIPARAGFTAEAGRGDGSRGDHPRSRGVYNTIDSGDLLPAGSSPLARGLRRADQHRSLLARIIPARAGFTVETSPYLHPIRDHPRSRGVYTYWSWIGCAARGSSPLARGLRRGPGPLHGRLRIIPARAGFTAPTEWT